MMRPRGGSRRTPPAESSRATRSKRRETRVAAARVTLYTHMKRHLAGVALTSATLLMTELALTRIFSVVMYYHFAFLAISIALFGLSASGVFAYVARRWLDRYATATLLALQSAIYASATVVALFMLVREGWPSHIDRAIAAR